jgi:hypothetical protein
MRFGLLTTALVLACGCGDGGGRSAFEGTWAGNKVVTGDGSSAAARDIAVSISDDGHGNLELNGLAPARVTSDRTFEALAVTYPTIYGPGYRGPRDGLLVTWRRSVFESSSRGSSARRTRSSRTR